MVVAVVNSQIFLAEKLGYKLYDRQIVHMAAAQLGISGMSESQLKEFEDKCATTFS